MRACSACESGFLLKPKSGVLVFCLTIYNTSPLPMQLHQSSNPPAVRRPPNPVEYVAAFLLKNNPQQSS